MLPSAKARMLAIDDGSLFADAGISNMLVGDFFSWYLDNGNWTRFEKPISRLITRLNGIDFDVTHKNPDSTRDLFKGMYEVFVPRELRHALGEVYTPDWLAAHALDQVNWKPNDQLLDPTCGTGTFILEGIRRRLVALHEEGKEATPGELLKGVYGIDLNPLAVLAARASLVVFLAPLLQPAHPVRLPIFLADAINSADARDAVFEHTLQTEHGPKVFQIPAELVNARGFQEIFVRVRDLVNANMEPDAILDAMKPHMPALTVDGERSVRKTFEILHELHENGWDGIWCPILADRFSAGAIPKVSHVVGNPPWVKWSHLPPEYAEFIKDRCLSRGVFSQDRWVGGIESDISTVITFEAMAKWMRKDGHLAFFITGTVSQTNRAKALGGLR